MTLFNAFHRSSAHPHLSMPLSIIFVLFHVSLRHVQSITKNKQIPQKPGLVRYLVSKLHGSEACNCRVQRMVITWCYGSRIYANLIYANQYKPKSYMRSPWVS